MDLKDFTDLGNDIGRRVNDAIYHMNFEQLNRDIRNRVDQAFGGASGTERFSWPGGKLYHGEETDQENWSRNWHSEKDFRQTPNHFRSADFKLYKETAKTNAGIPVISKPPGRVSGPVMMILGYMIAGGFGIAAVVTGTLSITMTSVGTVPSGVLGAAACGMAVPAVAGIVLAVVGTKRHGLVKRFWKYLSVLKGDKFCEIKKMARQIGKSERFTAKDLERMIYKGFFPEGHLDDKKTCFIGTSEMYEQYVQARDSAAESAANVKSPSGNTAQKQTESACELEKIIREGESYIKTIREANDAIYNREISEKLYRMETIVKKIFDYVRENPDQTDQLRRFMSYYMPTTEKLVNAYRELDEQLIQGETMNKAKKEIAQTLDTINEAYEKLYDSMYVDVAMDVSSDIAVLKTLFAQEGLTGNELNGGKGR